MKCFNPQLKADLFCKKREAFAELLSFLSSPVISLSSDSLTRFITSPSLVPVAHQQRTHAACLAKMYCVTDCAVLLSLSPTAGPCASSSFHPSRGSRSQPLHDTLPVAVAIRVSHSNISPAFNIFCPVLLMVNLQVLLSHEAY